MHLVKTFTQLHVRKIPSAYILKQYTHDGRSFIQWDRNDMPKGGQDGNREDMRFTKLVLDVMGIAWAGTKSDYACDEAHEKSVALRDVIDSISANVTRLVPTKNGGPDMNLDSTLTVAIVAPSLSQTKGHGHGRTNSESDVGGSAIRTSTYKHKLTIDGQEVIGSRSCGVCGLKGHYLTTCPRDPKRNWAMEKKGTKRGGARKRGRPRTRRGSPDMSRDSMDDHELLDDVDKDYDESE
jgi:hypothetical protein